MTTSKAMRSLARFVVVAMVLVVALAGAGASPAAAHAVLLSSSPTDRAALDAAPSQVVLEFSEAVSAGLGAVRVFDSAGVRVDTGAVDVAGQTITAPLQDDLPDGAYVVAWRAVSADSHPIHGALTFTVGDVAAVDDDAIAGLVGAGGDTGFEVAGTVARVLAYGGSLLAGGLAVFLLAAHDGRAAEASRLRRWVLRAAAVGVVGVLAAVPVRAALATGLGFGAVLEEGVLGQVLGDDVGLGSAACLLGLAMLAVDRGRRLVLSAGGLVVAAFGFAVSGHTATTEPAVLAITSDAAHVVAAAVWLGGLVGVATVLLARRSAEDPGDRGGAVAARFSGLAAVALVAVSVAGTALAWGEVRTLDALTGTTYGRLLLVKLAAVAVVALIGGWNRFRLVPALQRAPNAATAGLRRTVRVEAGLLLVTIAVTAVLVNVTPGRVAAGIGTIYSDTTAFGDGSVNLVVDPAQAGDNAVHLYFYDAAGRTTEPGPDVTVELSLPAADLGPIEREPFAAGPGHRQLDGRDLSIPGTWTVEVVVRVSRFEQETATFEVPISP